MAEPSAYFRQHYAVDAPVIDEAEFRTYWRINTRLDMLLHDRAITFVEWRAGQAFRTIAEKVIAGSWRTTANFDETKSRVTSGIDLNLAARHDAIGRLRELHHALGGFAIDLLEAHIVDDISWSALGQRLGVHSKTARTWTITTLRALAAVI